MEYFGTSLTDHGHYRWDLSDKYMEQIPYRFEQLPFHPESLTNNLSNGEVIFYQGGGYTVIGISGSCKDKRPGSKSIFWVKEIISKSDMTLRIMSNGLCNKILAAMPFKVKW